MVSSQIHVQQFIVIWWQAMKLQQGEISLEFELRANIVSDTGPWAMFIDTLWSHY